MAFGIGRWIKDKASDLVDGVSTVVKMVRGPSGKQYNVNDPYAKAQYDAEIARQNRVQEGVDNIDSAFAGFNDDYYTGYTNAYTAHYDPQLRDQYDAAVLDARKQLSGQGLLNSSAGVNALKDLSDLFNDAQLDIQGRANTATSDKRTEIENARSNLYAQNESAADPGSASSMANSQAQALSAAPQYTVLSDVFGGTLAGLGNYNQNAVSSQAAPSLTSLLFNNGSSGNGVRMG